MSTKGQLNIMKKRAMKRRKIAFQCSMILSLMQPIGVMAQNGSTVDLESDRYQITFASPSERSLSECFQEETPTSFYSIAQFSEVISSLDSSKDDSKNRDETKNDTVDSFDADKSLRSYDCSVFFPEKKNLFYQEAIVGHSELLPFSGQDEFESAVRSSIQYSFLLNDEHPPSESNFELSTFRLRNSEFETGEKYQSNAYDEVRLRCELILDDRDDPEEQEAFFIGSTTAIETQFFFQEGVRTTRHASGRFVSSSLGGFNDASQSEARWEQSDRDQENRFGVEFSCRKGLRANLGECVSVRGDVGARFSSLAWKDGAFELGSEVKVHLPSQQWLDRRRSKLAFKAQLHCDQYWDGESRDTSLRFGIESNLNLSDQNRVRCEIIWSEPLESNASYRFGASETQGRLDFLFGVSF